MPKTHHRKTPHGRRRKKGHKPSDDPKNPHRAHAPAPGHHADAAGVDPRIRFKAHRRGRH